MSGIQIILKNKLIATIALISFLVIVATVFAIYGLTNSLIKSTYTFLESGVNLSSHNTNEQILPFNELVENIKSTIYDYRRRLLVVFFSISVVVALLFLVISSSHLAQFRKSINEIDSVLMEFEKGNFDRNISLDYGNDLHGDHEVNRNELNRLFQRVNILGDRLLHMKNELSSSHKTAMERADRLASVGELAASIAHEIRNPVAGIINAMQVLSDDNDDNEERAIFDEVQTQAKRVDRAIDNLLSYARPSKPELSLTDLNLLFERAMVLMDGGIQDAKIALQMKLDSELPLVSVDPQQIQQVLVNLILNSVQAMNDGGELTLGTDVNNGSVCMRISDTGNGISDDKINTIFKPFYTTKPKGTGLGLAICRSIIQNHSGDVEVESLPDIGTTFIVKLPLT